ncbi:hypothetical protein ABZ816_00800 [Actinosynnema sp. NPDC047251]|uniref:Uncharacterized protein n=1 Tax=Saccharothrix espanaensis (strain ATCC 51144 / DSM 44229 / JCM 9112 / NBRC 15066 / NRRL 15764) TaxID=1179773 RepID=K0JXF7_SACES|nr:hypothetical protein [Saccharothrix espanaensis]CCH30786.1 hypothetical protein BN6_34880 [Saccharothrix espanaensis DSM 44229]
MGKYDHLFVENMLECADDLVNEGAAAGGERPANIGNPFGLMRGIDVDLSKVHMAYSWINPTSEQVHWVNDHEHSYDEVLMWMGNDPDNIHDLGAELYLDIEGERHTVTTTGAVFIPAGIRHCPLGFNWVKRSFSFIALSLNPDYASDENVPKHS